MITLNNVSAVSLTDMPSSQFDDDEPDMVTAGGGHQTGPSRPQQPFQFRGPPSQQQQQYGVPPPQQQPSQGGWDPNNTPW